MRIKYLNDSSLEIIRLKYECTFNSTNNNKALKIKEYYMEDMLIPQKKKYFSFKVII